MNRLFALACLGYATLAIASAYAGEQQNKMKGCSAEAKGMKGDERKAFMSKCLKKDSVLKSAAAKESVKPAASVVKTKQQDKMKSCNAEAASKALKGDERKKFMSTCLRN
jgi:hypothetical protein